MLSILKFSGTHWSRAAAAWILFGVAIDGLADAGAEAADAELAAYNAAVALGVLNVAERTGERGQYQVAKVEVLDLDLKSLDPATFADHDETAAAAKR
jgi:hypothetical protein